VAVVGADPTARTTAAYWVVCARLAELEERYQDVIQLYASAAAANAEVRPWRTWAWKGVAHGH
jgi:hypothetical protein